MVLIYFFVVCLLHKTFIFLSMLVQDFAIEKNNNVNGDFSSYYCLNWDFSSRVIYLFFHK